jgi:hypothetical protein
LPRSKPSNAIGTRDPAHSTETWSIRLLASSGNVRSYWRHSLPSERFQSMLAWMP